MNPDAEENPYFDFSEDEEVSHDFRARGDIPEWMEKCASEIQKSILRRNPSTSIKQLLGLNVSTLMFQLRAIQGQLRLLNVLATIIVLLLGIMISLPLLLIVGGE